MFVVGLTGGIGCGKSEAARIFAKLGVPIVDVDVIARHLTTAGQPVLQEIISAFGTEFLGADGNLNRAAMREKVFTDIAARKDLEGIMHPAIYDQALLELSQNKSAPYQILAISLLFENNRYKNDVSRSLVIDCDEALQVSRTMQRSGLTEQVVRGIMAAQVSRDIRRKLADDLIENNGSIEELSKKIAEIHEKYIHTCIVSE
jgi:dephospho-CoA kinase